MMVMLPQTGRPNNTITYRRWKGKSNTDLYHCVPLTITRKRWKGRTWLLSLTGKYGGLETIAWEMANMTLFDLVEPEVTHKVPKHWHSFPPPHPLWHPVLGTLYAIIGLFALFGNGVVLWVFCCTRNLRSGTNLLVINLAFSDLCMVISQFPILVCNCFSQAWVMGPFVCELYGFCGALFGTMSIINLAVIAYDRYRAILSPFGGVHYVRHVLEGRSTGANSALGGGSQAGRRVVSFADPYHCSLHREILIMELSRGWNVEGLVEVGRKELTG
ncbi:hypothetical protein Pcinc_002403 [Petrolisthes cinctipes]|uniref:G-protein coupled receptors family 1 profile domain-containing protein n=1 Tax=Petrolisthes cinctipes TaxID=88211 RepID=A0AAE1GJD8_PETCI|nr:hypothetical protein Pcinc_002403 [Petrolisthes cinctipes]